MASDGLSDDVDIESLQNHLAMLRANELVPTKHYILQQMVESVEGVATSMNLAVAQGTYLRGMKLALAKIDRCYGGVKVEDEGLVDRIPLVKNDPSKSLPPAKDVAVNRPNDPPQAEAAMLQQFAPMTDFTRFTDRLMQKKAADGNWDEKTKRQADSISKLFVKFMVQDQRIHDTSSLRQEHVGKFVDFLRFDIYKNYGKPQKDQARTIKQLREKGRSVTEAP